MLGALLPLGFFVPFDQIWADQSLQDKEDELEDIFGRKLNMFGGNPASNDGKREKVGFFPILNLTSSFLAAENCLLQLSCEEYGWGAAYPRRETIDNAFTCQGEFIYSIPHTWANSQAPRVT